MVNVKKTEEYANWLEQQPREVLSLLASRNALRVLPILRPILATEAFGDGQRLFLSALWATAIANSAATWGVSSVNRLSAANAAQSAAKAANEVAGYDHEAASALYSSAYAANLIAHPMVDAPSNALNASIRAANSFRSAAFDAAQFDINQFRSGLSAQKLITLPLWPQNKIPPKLDIAWLDLQSELLELDKNWRVWIDWYDGLLVGNTPIVEEIEIGDHAKDIYGRATFPPEMYQDPPNLNAALKKVINDYWAKQQEALSQDPVAEVFDANNAGQIDLATLSIGQGLHLTPIQEDWYAALRDTVTTALEAGQQLGQTKTPLEKFLEVLLQDMEQARVARLWPRANKLRRILDKHEKAARSEDFSLDKLETETAIDLKGVVGAYNNLRINDPNLITADENAKSPQEVDELQAQNETLQPIIKEAISEKIVTTEAAEVLNESADTLSEVGLQNEIMGRMAADGASIYIT